MGECTLDSKDGAPIRSAIEMLCRFSGEVALLGPGWEERLRQNPQELETLEREIVQSCKRGAGLMIAGLVSVVMQSREFAEASELVAMHLHRLRNAQWRLVVISGRWDERLNLMRLGRKSINLTDLSWNPQIMSKTLNLIQNPLKPLYN